MKYLLLALVFVPSVSYAATPVRSSSSSSGMITGVAVGMAVSAASHSSGQGRALSSEVCNGRKFAVAQCYDNVRRTTTHGDGFVSGCDGPKKTEYSFEDVVKDTGLPNAEIGNVIYDDYNDKFLITICYGETNDQ